MRVLLVNPPTLHRWRPVSDAVAREVRTPYVASLVAADANLVGGRSTLPGEHLGLQSLAAALRAAGHEADIIDAAGEWHSSLRQTAAATGSAEGYDLVGFTGPTDVIGENRWLMRALRTAGYTGPVVLGNDHASLNAQHELEATDDLDLILRGEGEAGVVSLVTALSANAPLDGVPGLSWRGATGIRHNAPGGPLDLDALAWPVRDRTAAVTSRGLSASMFTKRGCPYRCAHCTTGQLNARGDINRGQAWRTKSAGAAAHEFLALVERFGLSHVTIVDDLFVGKDASSRAWALEFSELLLEAGNRATFMVDCRIDSFDPPTLRALQRAGLARVFVGVESGSNASLKGLNKRYGQVEARAQLALLAEIGIDVILGFIFLTPGDTAQSMAESVGFLEAAGMHDYQLFSQRARIYPGSALEAQVRRSADLTGDYPFYGFRYRDPATRVVAEAVRQSSKRVEALAGQASLTTEEHRRLFASFAEGVARLCRLPASVLEHDPAAVERSVERLVLDCQFTLDHPKAC